MTIKEPENEEERLIIEEIKRKVAKRERLTVEEIQFAIKYPEYFIDSKELERINNRTDERILEKISVRYKNYRAWKR